MTHDFSDTSSERLAKDISVGYAAIVNEKFMDNLGSTHLESDFTKDFGMATNQIVPTAPE